MGQSSSFNYIESLSGIETTNSSVKFLQFSSGLSTTLNPYQGLKRFPRLQPTSQLGAFNYIESLSGIET